MRDTTAKERVLKKIRKALIHKTSPKNQSIDFERPVFPRIENDLAIHFAEQLIAVQGAFAYCENMLDFAENLIALVKQQKSEKIGCFEPQIQALFNEIDFPYLADTSQLSQVEIGVTGCEALLAQTGSVLVSSAQQIGRSMTIYPPIHVVVAFSSQLQPDLKSALKVLQNKYNGRLPSLLTAITGPSRTADIEKTLVLGAHGPKALYVFLVEDQGA
jgi:L-lactate dehydrogenase complex protein LldG